MTMTSSASFTPSMSKKGQFRSASTTSHLSSQPISDGDKCTCCPYGYHIDVDFLKFLDTPKERLEYKKLSPKSRVKHEKAALSSRQQINNNSPQMQNGFPTEHVSSRKSEHVHAEEIHRYDQSHLYVTRGSGDQKSGSAPPDPEAAMNRMKHSQSQPNEVTFSISSLQQQQQQQHNGLGELIPGGASRTNTTNHTASSSSHITTGSRTRRFYSEFEPPRTQPPAYTPTAAPSTQSQSTTGQSRVDATASTTSTHFTSRFQPQPTSTVSSNDTGSNSLSSRAPPPPPPPPSPSSTSGPPESLGTRSPAPPQTSSASSSTAPSPSPSFNLEQHRSVNLARFNTSFPLTSGNKTASLRSRNWSSSSNNSSSGQYQSDQQDISQLQTPVGSYRSQPWNSGTRSLSRDSRERNQLENLRLLTRSVTPTSLNLDDSTSDSSIRQPPRPASITPGQYLEGGSGGGLEPPAPPPRTSSFQEIHNILKKIENESLAASSSASAGRVDEDGSRTEIREYTDTSTGRKIKLRMQQQPFGASPKHASSSSPYGSLRSRDEQNVPPISQHQQSTSSPAPPPLLAPPTFDEIENMSAADSLSVHSDSTDGAPVPVNNTSGMAVTRLLRESQEQQRHISSNRSQWAAKSRATSTASAATETATSSSSSFSQREQQQQQQTAVQQQLFSSSSKQTVSSRQQQQQQMVQSSVVRRTVTAESPQVQPTTTTTPQSRSVSHEKRPTEERGVGDHSILDIFAGNNSEHSTSLRSEVSRQTSAAVTTSLLQHTTSSSTSTYKTTSTTPSSTVKRNVGINCKASTRDVGVFYHNEPGRGSQRTVGTNFSMDDAMKQSAVTISNMSMEQKMFYQAYFKNYSLNRTDITSVIQELLHRDVHSVGLQCNLSVDDHDHGGGGLGATVSGTPSSSINSLLSSSRTSTTENVFFTSTSDRRTSVETADVGCSDDTIDVQVIDPSQLPVTRSIQMQVSPAVSNQCTWTDKAIKLDMATNTTINSTPRHKSTNTIPQAQLSTGINTDQISRSHTHTNTDQRTFFALNILTNTASNTEVITRKDAKTDMEDDQKYVSFTEDIRLRHVSERNTDSMTSSSTQTIGQDKNRTRSIGSGDTDINHHIIINVNDLVSAEIQTDEEQKVSHQSIGVGEELIYSQTSRDQPKHVTRHKVTQTMVDRSQYKSVGSGDMRIDTLFCEKCRKRTLTIGKCVGGSPIRTLSIGCSAVTRTSSISCETDGDNRAFIHLDDIVNESDQSNEPDQADKNLVDEVLAPRFSTPGINIGCDTSDLTSSQAANNFSSSLYTSSSSSSSSPPPPTAVVAKSFNNSSTNTDLSALSDILVCDMCQNEFVPLDGDDDLVGPVTDTSGSGSPPGGIVSEIIDEDERLNSHHFSSLPLQHIQHQTSESTTSSSSSSHVIHSSTVRMVTTATHTVSDLKLTTVGTGTGFSDHSGSSSSNTIRFNSDDPPNEIHRSHDGKVTVTVSPLVRNLEQEQEEAADLSDEPRSIELGSQDFEQLVQTQSNSGALVSSLHSESSDGSGLSATVGYGPNVSRKPLKSCIKKSPSDPSNMYTTADDPPGASATAADSTAAGGDKPKRSISFAAEVVGGLSSSASSDVESDTEREHMSQAEEEARISRLTSRDITASLAQQEDDEEEDDEGSDSSFEEASYDITHGAETEGGRIEYNCTESEEDIPDEIIFVQQQTAPGTAAAVTTGAGAGVISGATDDDPSTPPTVNATSDPDLDTSSGGSGPMEEEEEEEDTDRGRQDAQTNTRSLLDQNIRETFELPESIRQACILVDEHLHETRAVGEEDLQSALDAMRLDWFKVSSEKLSNPHQAEDYLSSFNEFSKELLEKMVNLCDKNGNTALHYCVSHCNFAMVNLLLDTGVCDVNLPNRAGYTAIMLASLSNAQTASDNEIVRRLFESGNVNAQASQAGQTALMLAVSHGRSDMVSSLIDSGANLNLQDEDGSTALMVASEHGHLDIVKMLLSRPDCDVNLQDNDGSNALSIAMEAGNRDIGVLIYAHMNFSKNQSLLLRGKYNLPGSPVLTRR